MRRGVVLSAVGALVVAAALVWQDAYANFADTTTALPATITTATVAVGSNVEGYPALTLPAMRPGDSATECIIINSTGTKPSQVMLYGKDRATTGNLTSWITLVWTAGTGGGANGDCTGFVSNGVTVSTTMSAFPTTYAGGYLAWNTVGGTAAESRTYQLTYSMSSSAPATTKGGTASITFVWEAQNR